MKKTLIAIAVAGAALSLTPMMATAASKMQDQVNQMATLLAEAASYEKAHWGSIQNALDNFSSLDSVVNRVGSGKLVDSILIDNETGVITLTNGTSDTINKDLRGVTVIMTPTYQDDNGASQNFVTRTETSSATEGSAVESSRNIHEYTCQILTATGKQFALKQVGGQTFNFVAESKLSTGSFQGEKLENVFKKYCNFDSIS